jgi:redox-sensing transcriptional repressor
MTYHRGNRPAISIHTLERFPYYLSYLKTLDQQNVKSISSPTIAKALNLNEVQVRKDLAVLNSGGRPKTGYALEKLIADIETFLGYNNVSDAVLVGVGHLGRALLLFKGFENYGLNIISGFDINESIVNTKVGDKLILPLSKMNNLCQRLHIHIGIITVPAENAQAICEMLIESGIQAIWNFSPVKLTVPNSILVRNENMAASLAILSKHLIERTRGIEYDNKTI